MRACVGINGMDRISRDEPRSAVDGQGHTAAVDIVPIRAAAAIGAVLPDPTTRLGGVGVPVLVVDPFLVARTRPNQ